VLKSRLARFRAGAKGLAAGKATVQANRAFMATDIAAGAAGVESRQDVLNKVEGMEGPELYEKAKQDAETRQRILNPDWKSPMYHFAQQMRSIVTYPTEGVSGPEHVKEEGAAVALKMAGQRVGIDVEGGYPNLKSGWPTERAKAYEEAAAAIRAKGGDPLMSREMDAMVRQRGAGIIGPGVPAQRPGAAPGGPAAPAPAAGAGAAAPGPVTTADPKLVGVNQEQLVVLRDIRNAVSRVPTGGGGGWSMIGPMEPDAPDYSGRRAGMG